MEDGDVDILRSTSPNSRPTIGRGVLFVERKVKLTLQLIDAWVGSGKVDSPEVELMLHLVVTLASHREWRDMEVQGLGVRCFVGLINSVAAEERVGLMNRMRVFCAYN